MKLLETFVYISAKDDAMKAGLKSASKYARKEVNDLQRLFDSLSFKAFNVKNMVVGAASLWGAKQAIDQLVGSTVKLGSAYTDMSQRTGVSVETLSALGHAAKLTGADTDSLEKSLRQLTNNMLDASRGTGAARQTFKELGMSVTDSRGQLRSTVDVMMEFADKIAATTNETRQAAYASELFGARTGTKLLPMLKQGSAGLRAMMDEARRLGIVMTDEEAAAADELGDSLDTLTGAMEGLKRAIAIGVIPSITAVVKQFTEWIVANREIIRAKVSEWIQKIADGMKLLWDHRETIKKAFEVTVIVLITSRLIALWEILDKIAKALATIGASKAFGFVAGSGFMAGAATTGIGLGAAATVYGGKKYADAVTPKGYLPGLPYASVMPTKMPTVPLNDPYGIIRAAERFNFSKASTFGATSFYDTVRAGGGTVATSGGGSRGALNLIDFRTALSRYGTSGLPMVRQFDNIKDWSYQNPGIGQFGAENWDELAEQNRKYAKEIEDRNREMTDALIANAGSFGQFWGDTMMSLYDRSDKSFQGILASFTDMLKDMAIRAMASGIFGMLFGGLSGKMTAKQGFLSGFGGALNNMLGFEAFGTGGTAYKPTLAVIGDTGPERVLNPVETRAYERGAGKAAYTDNSQIIINFSGSATRDGAAEVAAQLDRIIRERKSRELEKLRRGVA